MSTKTYQADVVIAGGGLAGLTAAYELLERGVKVLVIEKGPRDKLGGLAKESFGGVHMIGTPHQRRMRIKDSPELALKDWESFAQFGAPNSDNEWPRAWAKYYCENSLEIFEFLTHKKIEFLPLVNWPERGMFRPGNSLPRWHITWGTGYEIIFRLVNALEAHPNRAKLELLYDHEVSGFTVTNGRAVGVHGKSMADGSAYEARGENVVIASGGMCGGDLSKVRANWYKDWGTPPKIILNGAHDFGDGLLQDSAADLGARVTHLDKQWHYAAGVHHPAKRRPADGLSLLPPRSALWMNAKGERIGPVPLMGYTDMRYAVEQIVKQPGQYSWQVMNWKIAITELAVSGCDFMTAFRYKSKLKLLRNLIFGNKEMVSRLIKECPDDIVVAYNLSDLVKKMNERGLDGHRVDLRVMEDAIREYDDQCDRGPAYFCDDQLRRIMSFRANRGDRIRMCKYQKIVDQKAMPLIAIREFILSRKSLGGIQTDLACRVLKEDGRPIPGLFAVGEAAGFGGGGAHGLGSLEGTFLGGCVLTGRVAARSIAGKT
ncbi:MAG: FAD-dependent oxidoreductase [Deltaproteobacteria bacterium]|nr:FAD-dependent oxidoreductase [Deltaproteobacteria bacterium]